MGTQKFLILIVGPTAVGKTSFCLNLANRYQAGIVSCDSRQFYREMDLGTAKPSPMELASAPHYFINSRSIEEDYDVKQFEKDAIELLEKLFAQNRVVIMTGGSGLFAAAVTDGLDEMQELDPQIRREIIAEYELKGLTFLQEEVKNCDPEYFKLVDQQNPQRLMRALEVYRGTGKPFSDFRVKQKINRPFEVIKIGLERPREELYARIERRMDAMIEAGLFDEADALFSKRHLNALQTLGYTEIFNFLEGKYDREEVIRLLKRNSRRYAKRQLTWFKRDADIRWFNPENEADILTYLKDQIG
ncbi:MAG: tRNA dimethylallyltransferase [Algoriphagus sp.]